MRIAIYSGSFNPVHNGHIAIAHAVLDSGQVDELWFLVSPLNPLKKTTDLWPEHDRLEMVKLAIQNEPNMKASDYEFTHHRPAYTINTLNSLKSDFPGNDFVLLVGGDNLDIFQRWYKAKEIIDNYGLIVYPRPGFPLSEYKHQPNVRIIEAPLLNISATAIREKIKKGETVKDMVPPGVEKYIQKNLTG